MRVLAINCGSSSLKCSIVDAVRGLRLREMHVPGLASPAVLEQRLPELLDEMLATLDSREAPAVVAHRIVHGGDFAGAVKVDDDVLAHLEALGPMVSLHNRPALRALALMRARLRNLPHVATFDTAFHAGLPRHSRCYALPRDLCEEHGIHRYGFHGLSHANVVHGAAAFLGEPASGLRIVSCHLGSGASVCAIEQGRSVDTSMGMTPLEGLVMGSRCGDLDPGVILHLLRSGMTAGQLEELLNRASGLLGLTGTQDLRSIEIRAAAGDESCDLALTMFDSRVRKYIGAYAATLGGIEVITFTGGIGEHSATMRHRCLQRLEFLGVELDERRNRHAVLSGACPVVEISSDASRVKVLVCAAGEDLEMARQAVQALPDSMRTPLARIRIAVSARHAHLSSATIDRLFGPGHRLRVHAELAQPGQFAAEETVALAGPRGRIEHVRLIGPPRDRDQVEISHSDGLRLGVEPPLRMSGNLHGSSGILLEGPGGSAQLDSGVICALRHVHMNSTDAQALGVDTSSFLTLRLGEPGREVVMQSVRVRISDQFATELHLDTDEANALGVKGGDFADILPALESVSSMCA